jgi:hypothetical protein
MFWDSYRIEGLTKDPTLRDLLYIERFWANAESEGLVWRNREFAEVAEFALPALSPFPESGRLMMRGLYLPIGAPWPWDNLILWMRRWQRGHPS